MPPSPLPSPQLSLLGKKKTTVSSNSKWPQKSSNPLASGHRHGDLSYRCVVTERSLGWQWPSPSAGGRGGQHSSRRCLKWVPPSFAWRISGGSSHWSRPPGSILHTKHTRHCPCVAVMWPSSSFSTIIWKTNPNFSDIQSSFNPSTVAPSSSGPVWNILSQVGHPLASPSTLHMPPYLLPHCHHWGDYVTHFNFFPIQNSNFTMKRLEPHSRLIFVEISLTIPNPWWCLDQFGFKKYCINLFSSAGIEDSEPSTSHMLRMSSATAQPLFMPH